MRSRKQQSCRRTTRMAQQGRVAVHAERFVDSLERGDLFLSEGVVGGVLDVCEMGADPVESNSRGPFDPGRAFGSLALENTLTVGASLNFEMNVDLGSCLGSQRGQALDRCLEIHDRRQLMFHDLS